jgi:hypothetical protein
VYAPIGLAIIIGLPTEGRRMFSWDQRDMLGQQVSTGGYQVRLHAYVGDGPLQTFTQQFWIATR